MHDAEFYTYLTSNLKARDYDQLLGPTKCHLCLIGAKAALCFRCILRRFWTYHYTETSLLNRVGCVVTWVTWIRGLRGSVGVWVTWVTFLPGLRGLRGSKCFLRGSTFYVGHNFYASCVGQIYFCAGQSFLRG